MSFYRNMTLSVAAMALLVGAPTTVWGQIGVSLVGQDAFKMTRLDRESRETALEVNLKKIVAPFELVKNTFNMAKTNKGIQVKLVESIESLYAAFKPTLAIKNVLPDDMKDFYIENPAYNLDPNNKYGKRIKTTHFLDAKDFFNDQYKNVFLDINSKGTFNETNHLSPLGKSLYDFNKKINNKNSALKIYLTSKEKNADELEKLYIAAVNEAKSVGVDIIKLDEKFVILPSVEAMSPAFKSQYIKLYLAPQGLTLDDSGSIVAASVGSAPLTGPDLSIPAPLEASSAVPSTPATKPTSLADEARLTLKYKVDDYIDWDDAAGVASKEVEFSQNSTVVTLSRSINASADYTLTLTSENGWQMKHPNGTDVIAYTLNPGDPTLASAVTMSDSGNSYVRHHQRGKNNHEFVFKLSAPSGALKAGVYTDKITIEASTYK